MIGVNAIQITYHNYYCFAKRPILYANTSPWIFFKHLAVEFVVLLFTRFIAFGYSLHGWTCPMFRCRLYYI